MGAMGSDFDISIIFDPATEFKSPKERGRHLPSSFSPLGDSAQDQLALEFSECSYSRFGPRYAHGLAEARTRLDA